MSNLKVEGKVADFCPKCKNCKSTTMEHDGKTASVRLTDVKCEDPYDGMIKTLSANSDICCSMFDPKPDRSCNKCERFDGTITISYKALFGESVDCPSFEEKKEKEPCDKISLLQHELEMGKLRKKVHELEKEKAAHMKGIERLKKSKEELEKKIDAKNKDIDILLDENKRLKLRNDNQVTMIDGLKLQYNDLSEKLKNPDISKVANLEAQIKNLKYLNEESYKREEELEEKIHALQKECNNWEGDYERLRNYLLFPICEVLYGDQLHEYNMLSDIVKDIKDLRVQSDENGTMYEDLKYWKERCHNAETDVTTLNSKVGALNNMYNRLKDKNDKEIENLKEKNEELTKMVERRDKWVEELKSDVDTLQNECLVIAEIAKRAYDETNRD